MINERFFYPHLDDTYIESGHQLYNQMFILNYIQVLFCSQIFSTSVISSFLLDDL